MAGHGRTHFYKYMTAETAEKVLETGRLRWSSPLLFNDPFDVPRNLVPGASASDIFAAANRLVEELITNPPDDTSGYLPKLQLLLEAIKRGVPEELRAEMIAGVQDVQESHEVSGESLEEFRELWREFLNDYRILCLTETPSHAAMWYHYADAWQGAVLEFRCVRERDSAWLIAKPVAYPVDKPAVYSAAGWARLLALRADVGVPKLMHEAAYTKSPDWSYEREWRIASFKRSQESGLYSDYEFHSEELSAVYFGPQMPAETRSRLSPLVARYSGAKVIQVSVGMSRELCFEDYQA